jgi:hypothetical protein
MYAKAFKELQRLKTVPFSFTFVNNEWCRHSSTASKTAAGMG